FERAISWTGCSLSHACSGDAPHAGGRPAAPKTGSWRRTTTTGATTWMSSLVRPLVWSASAGRTHEQLPPIRERNVAAVGSIRASLGPISLDVDFGSRRERIFGKAASEQSVRGAGLDHPVHHLAVGALHVHINPRVRIDPFHLRDGATKFHRCV